ncbi:phage baseplate protein [uncultured Bilophila sp.]|uniref:phage baseplate protein n=1 Tax=uncultured Bilophila sp. TaxID=529385 RepID=UPI00280B75C7|nr:hypothetical protein [uncultured Bilophila sp.]
MAVAASTPHWALISDKGTTVAPFDSMLSIDVKNENKLLSSPVEEGGFASYNKVASPLDIYVELAASASESGHAALLAALDKLASGTELVSLVTPDQEYRHLNIESYTVKRTATEGATLLVAELHLLEVRQVKVRVSQAAIRSPKRPTSASKVDRGLVQAQPYISLSKRSENAGF